MTNPEFESEFDVLYNSITSNQAPGLDSYEKSVFLTKAQDELIKAYFDPRRNKVAKGFDDSEERQIDFSSLTSNMVLDEPPYFEDPVFDKRDHCKSVCIGFDVLMFLNEYVEVTRPVGNNSSATVRLTVVPIDYNEYNRLMSKPYKRPLKNQAWRLLDSSNERRVELIVGPADEIKTYAYRYIKKPTPIILNKLEDITIDEYYGSDLEGNPTKYQNKAIQGIPCTLDSAVHKEILQRAVELAKATYLGDLQNQISVGTASQTPIGIIQQPSQV